MGLARSVPITNLHLQRSSQPLYNCAVGEIQGFRNNQEDAHNMANNVNSKGLMLFGIYDGHGGPNCSLYLQHNMIQTFQDLDSIEDHTTILNKMFALDERFFESRLTDGSTCCIVLAQLYLRTTNTPITDLPTYLTTINNDLEQFMSDTYIKVVSINIGDSRAVILRKRAIFPKLDPETGEPIDDDDETLQESDYFEPITVDHKPTDPKELDRIRKSGGTVENGRVDGTLALSRAFGDVQYKTPISYPPDKQRVTVLPDFQTHSIEWGDVLFISCDGIFEAEVMTYSQVAQELAISLARSSHHENEGNNNNNNNNNNNATNNNTTPTDEQKDTEVKVDDDNKTAMNDGDDNTKTETQDETKTDTTTPPPTTTTDDAFVQDDKSNESTTTTPATTTTPPSTTTSTVDPDLFRKFNYDPAIACRDIIATSLLAGSKDNHTAMVITFKPPMITTPTISSLPSDEIIPGPFSRHRNNDQSFDKSYREDIGNELQNYLELIFKLDEIFERFHFHHENPDCVAMVKNALQECGHSTVLPIIYGQPSYEQQHHYSQPYQQHSSFTMYDDDDDDDYGGQ